MQNQGLSPVNGRAVLGGLCGRPQEAHECRCQVRWTVHPRTTSPSLGSCSWIGEWGDAVWEEGVVWAVDPGDALFLMGAGGAADPWCLGPACEDCVFNPKRLAQKWVDSLCELCLQPVGGGLRFWLPLLVYECGCRVVLRS